MRIIFLLLGCFVIYGCGQERVVTQNEVDFLQKLNQAELIQSATEFITPTYTQLDGVPKWGIFQHAPSEIVYHDIQIGENPAFDFSIGLLEEAWTGEGDGVRFEIAANLVDGSTKTIYSRYINPKEIQDQRKWLSERILAESIAKTTADIVLKTIPNENNSSDWAVWGKPMLYSDGVPAKKHRHNKTNVILITLDTVRSDYIGIYGNEWVKTPQMDYFAKNGVLFENAFSPTSTTSPAHASILTSLYPNQHGVISNRYHLAQSIPRLPLMMFENGYKTGAAVSVYHLQKKTSGLALGFNAYSDVNSDKWPGESFAYLTRGGSATTSAALEWLDQVHNHPFFLWLHYYDPHAPYEAPAPYHKMYYDGDPTSQIHQDMNTVLLHDLWSDAAKEWVYPFRDLDYFKKEYGAEISYVDGQIARLWQALKRLKVDNNTMIIIAADHGEHLGEHDIYFDHWTTYNYDIKVPLIVYYPKRVPKGLRVDETVSVIDIAPTILDVIGNRSHPLSKGFQGRSLKPLWNGSGGWQREKHAAEALLYTSAAAWDDRYKLIWELRYRRYHERLTLLPDKVTIYDAENDPHEETPIGEFYWADEKQTAPVWDQKVALPESRDEKKIKNVLEKTKERVCQKKVPSVEVLRGWFEQDIESNWLRADITANTEFFERIVALMQVLKAHACPPPVKDYLAEKAVLDSITQDNLEFTSQSIDDPAFLERMKNLPYADY